MKDNASSSGERQKKPNTASPRPEASLESCVPDRFLCRASVRGSADINGRVFLRAAEIALDCIVVDGRHTKKRHSSMFFGCAFFVRGALFATLASFIFFILFPFECRPHPAGRTRAAHLTSRPQSADLTLPRSFQREKKKKKRQIRERAIKTAQRSSKRQSAKRAV